MDVLEEIVVDFQDLIVSNTVTPDIYLIEDVKVNSISTLLKLELV